MKGCLVLQKIRVEITPLIYPVTRINRKTADNNIIRVSCSKFVNIRSVKRETISESRNDEEMVSLKKR